MGEVRITDEMVEAAWADFEARLAGGGRYDKSDIRSALEAALDAARACETCGGTGKEARHQLCRDCDELDAALSGMAEPVGLDVRMKAAGMFSVAEMLSGTPIDKFLAHTAVRDLDSFGKWLDMRHREFTTMKAQYALGDKDITDDLYEWVEAHYAVFHEVAVNFRAALQTEGK